MGVRGSSPGRGRFGPIIELVASRGPIPRDVIEAELGPIVPPGVAARAYQTRLRKSRETNTKHRISNRAHGYWKPNPDEVDIGKRLCIRGALKGFIEREYLTYDKETGIIAPGPRWDVAAEGYLNGKG